MIEGLFQRGGRVLYCIWSLSLTVGLSTNNRPPGCFSCFHRRRPGVLRPWLQVKNTRHCAHYVSRPFHFLFLNIVFSEEMVRAHDCAILHREYSFDFIPPNGIDPFLSEVKVLRKLVEQTDAISRRISPVCGATRHTAVVMVRRHVVTKLPYDRNNSQGKISHQLFVPPLKTKQKEQRILQTLTPEGAHENVKWPVSNNGETPCIADSGVLICHRCALDRDRQLQWTKTCHWTCARALSTRRGLIWHNIYCLAWKNNRNTLVVQLETIYNSWWAM